MGKTILNGKLRAAGFVLEFHIDEHDGAERPRESVTHQRIHWPYLSFAMSAHNRDQAGQCRDAVRENATQGYYQLADPEREKLFELLDLWGRWHLNDMMPGCVHQESGAYEPPISEQKCYEVPERDEYLHHVYRGPSRYGAREARKHLVEELHAGKPGPWAELFERQHYYAYGHAWLVEELPQGFTQRVGTLWRDLGGTLEGRDSGSVVGTL